VSNKDEVSVNYNFLKLPKLPPVFSVVRVTRSLVFCMMIYRSLFVLLYFFFWPLCYLFFFDLRIMITPFGIFKLLLSLSRLSNPVFGLLLIWIWICLYESRFRIMTSNRRISIYTISCTFVIICQSHYK